jgi:hypothetical protein
MSTTRCFGDGDGDEHKLVPLAGDLALGSPILAVRGAYRSMPGTHSFTASWIGR